MSVLLFPPSCTHVEVRCWQCEHIVELKREDAEPGITEAAFVARARCSKCKAGWPGIIRFPKPVSRWGR